MCKSQEHKSDAETRYSSYVFAAILEREAVATCGCHVPDFEAKVPRVWYCRRGQKCGLHWCGTSRSSPLSRNREIWRGKVEGGCGLSSSSGREQGLPRPTSSGRPKQRHVCWVMHWKMLVVIGAHRVHSERDHLSTTSTALQHRCTTILNSSFLLVLEIQGIGMLSYGYGMLGRWDVVKK
jgi:hypothetical protein